LSLRDTLRAAGFLVEIEVAFPFGKDLDGDVVALLDGALFIFECKHAYHPCNVRAACGFTDTCRSRDLRTL